MRDGLYMFANLKAESSESRDDVQIVWDLLIQAAHHSVSISEILRSLMDSKNLKAD